MNPIFARAIGPLALAASSLVLAGSALAAEGASGSGASEVTFLVQVCLLLVVGRLLGEGMHRIGQPAVMGQLLAGILLGPSVFGSLWPAAQHVVFPSNPEQKAMLNGVSQLGILLLLLITGMETDLGLVRKVRRAALSVSMTGIALPFACGVLLGEFLPESMLPRPDLRLITSLFLGTTLSISSVKIVAAVVREMDFMRRMVGQVIVASAIIDDTIGWVIIAITFSLALHGSIDLWSLAQTLIGTALFLGLSLTLGRRVVFVIIRWANDHLRSEAAVITAILVIMGSMALTTHAIGVHTVLGAFVAGILIGQSPILTRRIDEQLRGLVTALFAPVFFGLAGLSSDLTILGDPHLLLLTAGLVAIASVGKFAGAFAGGALGGLRPAESLALACGMNARGSTEIIVASIGLSIGALSPSLFTMIVAMAFITTMAMPPMLRWALSRLPMDKAEKDRLEREALEATGFVSRLERLLVAADSTAKGRFASRLAGLMAGSRGMPVTVLQIEAPSTSAAAERFPVANDDGVAGAAGLGRAVQAAAEIVQAQKTEEEAEPKLPVDVSEETPEAPESVIAAAAGKGFDFLLIGIEPTGNPEGGFNQEVAQVANSFAGPFAIVAARGAHLAEPEAAPLGILLPVNGTDVSRRGAEVALSIARAARSSVTALFVSPPAEEPRRRRFRTGRRRGEAVLREIVAMADRQGVDLRTAIRTNVAAEEAILRQTRLGRHDLIVMGVARRPGKTLSFGTVAETALESAECSIVFVAT